VLLLMTTPLDRVEDVLVADHKALLLVDGGLVENTWWVHLSMATR